MGTDCPFSLKQLHGLFYIRPTAFDPETGKNSIFVFGRFVPNTTMAPKEQVGAAMADVGFGFDNAAIPPAITGQEFLLGTIRAINREFLAVVTAPEFTGTYKGRQFLGPLSPLFLAPSQDAVSNALKFPFLLMDLRLSSESCWRELGTSTAPGVQDASDLAHTTRLKLEPIFRTTMTLALHLARTEREAGLILMGMSPEVADLLTARGFHELEPMIQVAATNARPRWAELPAIWAQVFASPGGAPIKAARAFVLHALQLSATESPLPSRAAPRHPSSR